MANSKQLLLVDGQTMFDIRLKITNDTADSSALLTLASSQPQTLEVLVHLGLATCLR